MRNIVLAGIFSLAASTALAQTAPEPAAPSAPAAPAETQQAGPANLCQELLAFMKAPPPEPATPAAPAKPAAAPAAQGTSALAGTTAGAGQGAAAAPQAGSNSAQAVTGQDGVATDAPKPSGGEKVAAGSVTNAPQKDRAAPMPPADVTSTPKESVLDVAKAEQLADANDIAQCQQTAREMRVAGVAMPPPLMALAALDLQYQAGASAPSEASDPAAGGQGTAAPAPQ